MQLARLFGTNASLSLKDRLSAAKDNILDLAGKAKHGLASARQTVGREASALLGRSAAQARTAPGAYVKPATPLSQQAVVAQLSAAYKAAKGAANNMDVSSAGTFLRNTNEASRAANKLGDAGYADAQADIIISDMADKPPLPLSAASAKRDGTSPFSTIVEDKRSDFDIARDGVRQAEKVLTGLFGQPGNDSSIRSAASQLPQPLKDYLRTVFQAIDDSSADTSVKDRLKDRAVIDAVLLRTINPKLTNATENISDVTKRNLVELTAFMQFVGNGIEINDKFSDNTVLLTQGSGRGTQSSGLDRQGFGTKWGDTVKKFGREVAAQGSETNVIRAKYGPNVNQDTLHIMENEQFDNFTN